MKDRIRKIIESQNMTQQEFAECIKVAPATLSSIFTGRTAPSLKIVEAIKSRFPDISTDWLMFGKGAMTDYKSTEAGASFDNPTVAGDGGKKDSDGGSAGQLEVTANQELAIASVAMVSDVARKNTPQCRDVRKDDADEDASCVVKKCDKRERHIVEIRIFYDDQTWETFVPKQ